MDAFFKKQWFINSSKQDIKSAYDFKTSQALGTGSFGQVFMGKCKSSGQRRAIKQINKKLIQNQKQFEAEVTILRELDHPNVIKLFETFEDKDNVYLVMEICDGGELFFLIDEKGFFQEKKAKVFFQQIMNALNYCHSHGVCHRDLKLENFLLLNKGNDSVIKLIDFGMSKVFNPKQEKQTQMKTLAGTPYYISPEVLNKKYDISCDIWSAGVILYILICGMPPFWGNSDDEIFEKIKSGTYDFKPWQFKKVSKNCIDLIKKMIAPIEKRLTAQQVLSHPWVQEQETDDVSNKLDMMQLKKFQSMILNSDYSKFKIFVLSYIVSQLSDQETQVHANQFLHLDQNHDGTLTLIELKQGLYNFDEDQAQELYNIFTKIDSDNSGQIDYSEFLVCVVDNKIYNQKKLEETFKKLDYNNQGKITPDGLLHLFGCKIFKLEKSKKTIEYYQKMFQESQLTGPIDKNQFLKLLS